MMNRQELLKSISTEIERDAQKLYISRDKLSAYERSLTESLQLAKYPKYCDSIKKPTIQLPKEVQTANSTAFQNNVQHIIQATKNDILQLQINEIQETRIAADQAIQNFIMRDALRNKYITRLPNFNTPAQLAEIDQCIEDLSLSIHNWYSKKLDKDAAAAQRQRAAAEAQAANRIPAAMDIEPGNVNHAIMAEIRNIRVELNTIKNQQDSRPRPRRESGNSGGQQQRGRQQYRFHQPQQQPRGRSENRERSLSRPKSRPRRPSFDAHDYGNRGRNYHSRPRSHSRNRDYDKFPRRQPSQPPKDRHHNKDGRKDHRRRSPSPNWRKRGGSR